MLALNCIVDITFCMSQRHFKLKLNVPQTKIIISFPPQNLVLFQGSVSELIHHPSCSTSQKPIMFDITFSLYNNYLSCSVHFISLMSLPSMFTTTTLNHYLSHGQQHWPPNRTKYIHSGPFQSVLLTLVRGINSEHKTNLSHACLI